MIGLRRRMDKKNNNCDSDIFDESDRLINNNIQDENDLNMFGMVVKKQEIIKKKQEEKEKKKEKTQVIIKKEKEKDEEKEKNKKPKLKYDKIEDYY